MEPELLVDLYLDSDDSDEIDDDGGSGDGDDGGSSDGI